MRYEILSNGEKIKRLRKELGARQEDLACEGNTRSNINRIENNKQELTAKTAKLIYKKMLYFAQKNEKNTEHITEQYLLETPEYQANEITKNIISELDDFAEIKDINKFNSKKNEIELFLNKYEKYISLSNQAKIYYSLGKAQFKLYQFDESYINAFRSRDISYSILDFRINLKSFALLIKISYKLDRMSEVLSLSKFALSIAKAHKINDEELLKDIYFNTALAYIKNHNYDECIRYIDIFTKLEIREEELLKAELIRANCFYDTKRYSSAETLYFELLIIAKQLGNEETKCRIYTMIAMLYLQLNQRNNVIYYADLLVSLDTNDVEINALNLYYALYCYKELDMYDLVKKYLIRTLNLLLKSKNESSLLDTIIEVSNYYISKDYLEDLYSLCEYTIILLNPDNNLGANISNRLLTLLYKSACIFQNSGYDLKFSYIFNNSKKIETLL